MSVFGSLFTAVSGLTAQSQAISMISNNIANVATVGYKRTDASFASLVTSLGRSSAYSPGSVVSQQNARVNQQGILQQSTSGTDIAISGNGFFIVRETTDTTGEPLYTRAGSFSEDSSGVLRNSSGKYLQGWPLDQNGALPASQADISSLVPVNVAFVGGLTQPTTQASLALNLTSAEAQSAYPIVQGFVADFKRGIKIFDSLGEGHDLTMNFKKMTTPTTDLTGTVDISDIVGTFAADPDFAGTETFDITLPGSVPAGPTTITLDGDVPKLLADINAIVDVDGNSLAYAQLNANGFLTIKARNIGDSITLADGAGTPLALGTKLGLAAVIGANAAPAAPTLLTPLAETANTEGWWTLSFTTPANATVNFGAINFTGAGKLNGTTDLNGEILVNLPNIDWGNGSDPQTLNFDISGFSQFSGDYNVISSQQNGAELGLRTGVSIDENGFVVAQFSNGQSTELFKLAIATFANSNGLTELTGNTFRESTSSGSFNLREAGNGSAGNIASGALEGANVDMAEEFSKMIVTQRAYSANTKVISTVDQMLQELLQLR